MSATPQEIFQRYVYAGAMTRNADALAELFTEDGVLEAPLLAAGSAFPRRTAGREAIRAALAEYYARPVGGPRTPNLEKSGYVLHTTADPDVFIAEIDTVFDGEEGEEEETVSLVQVFRLRDGRIARLRDYFAPSLV
ncbi:nuclear transport factor 2 family protein [Kitasatospora sp. NPDC051853]|uniref:nuclear transport factor 2 family protein n=1 Tax=Kitasatospora sp. NPDC051853 TaxID=3364058 RepID=UPI0037A423A2